MAAGRLFIPGWMPARDSNGAPIPNVSVSFYQNETDILASIFSDEGLTTPLANPVYANSSGRFPQIYASDSITYSASVDAPYGPPGQPFTFDGLQASQAADIAAANLAQGAAEDAETALNSTLSAIDTATQVGGGSAALAGALAAQTVLATKADLAAPDFTAQPTLNSRPLLSAPAAFFPTYVDNIGVVEGASGGNGLANSTAINTWLAANPGKTLLFRPGGLYRIGSRILMQAGSRLACESAVNRATLYMTTSFSNTDFTQRDTATSCGILASGQTSGSFIPISNVGLENLIIQSDTADGRVLRGLYVRNALNTKIINVEVFGIPCGVGMCLSGVRGDTLIESAYIHDFITNSTAFTGAGFGQLTAIEFDNDLVNGIVSENVRISGARIDNLTPGAAFIGLYGDQSDGINIANTSTRAFVISGLNISRVNEALDIFGREHSIAGGVYADCRGSAVKFVHGAKYNSLTSPTIIRPWLNGIVFSGSPSSGVGDTAFNTVTGGVVRDVNPLNNQGDAGTCGVRFQPNNGAASNQLPRNNTVTGMSLISGAFGKYGWLDELAAGANSNNVGEGLNIPTGWVDRKVFAPNAGGTGGVRLKRTTTYTEDLT